VDIELVMTQHSFIHSLYSINLSLGTDTTGSGTCQNIIHSMAKQCTLILIHTVLVDRADFCIVSMHCK